MSAFFLIIIAGVVGISAGGGYFIYKSASSAVEGHKTPFIWISVSAGFTLLALARTGWLLHLFYLSTANLSPGTGIRPMGMALELCIAGFLSIILGGICALIGFLLGAKHKHWHVSLLAILTGILTWIPFFFGVWGLHYIAALRKLVFED